MIKEGLVVNEGIDENLIVENDADSEIIVLQKVMKKRRIIKGV